jgi:hypothetical protein
VAAEEDRQFYLRRGAELREMARTAKFSEAKSALIAVALLYERLATGPTESDGSFISPEEQDRSEE